MKGKRKDVEGLKNTTQECSIMLLSFYQLQPTECETEKKWNPL